MFSQLKYLKSFFLNYKNVLLRTIFYELIYSIKNLENVSEVGVGLGLGIAFGVVGNQIDFGFGVSKREGVYLIDEEIIQNFSVGITIGDLWFVKRRET